MADPSTGAITQLLDAAAKGDAPAVERFWTAAHEEVRAIARVHLGREGPDCSLQTTALANEVYLRLGGNAQFQWENRRHFFGAVARAIREILIDDARKRRRLKRGGGRALVPLEDDVAAPSDEPMMVLAIDEALEKLEQIEPGGAEVVRLRYFLGLSVGETATVLELSPRTVNNKWHSARVWLHRELSKGDSTWRGKGPRG
ncbi:MAG: sigma-70 family RNA polymerase sigma factor [Phycisphaerales bacterium]|nr:MAG: sigma-70 family RNA polymerase sigma factor [Phycisphaerales bacterium]